MDFSIVIPVYNGADTIASCLRAVTEQSGFLLDRDYEIIVVDDGSNDDTAVIVAEFPVRLIRLESNRGRIIARKAGAEHARSSRLVFVDSRVEAPSNMLLELTAFPRDVAVMGEVNSVKLKYRSPFNTVFYLIRRKFYGPEYFPLQVETLYITPDNFNRAPKGTTMLCIDREVFLRLIPERCGRNVNDDTLLFRALVFTENYPLLRTRRIFCRYRQRADLKQFVPWLFDRGVRFADYYFRPGSFLFKPLLVLIGMAGFLLLAILVNYECLAPVVALLSLVLVGAVLWLSENVRDLFTLLLILPFILIVFGAGFAKWCVMKAKSGLAPATQPL